MASLHADSGEVELALKELNETIAIKRRIGRDESTAQSLQQAASLAYDTGDNETARHDVEQARQIFAACSPIAKCGFGDRFSGDPRPRRGSTRRGGRLRSGGFAPRAQDRQ